MEVIGFGRDSNGYFKILIRQAFIEGYQFLSMTSATIRSKSLTR